MRANFVLLLSSLSLLSELVECRAVLSPAISPPSTHWKRSAKVPGNQIIHIDLALSVDEASSDEAARALEDISDPSSSNFGQHWSAKEVADFFAPPKQKIHEVAKWLTSSGVPHSSLRLSSDRTHVSFDTTVHQAESLLGAEFHQYSTGEEAQVASETYSLPQEISEYIDFVLPAPEPAPGQTAPESASIRLRDGISARDTPNIDCFEYMSPACLRELYNMDDGAGQTSHPNNSYGVFTPAGSTWLGEDLDKFYEDFAPHLVGQRPEIMSINGGYRQEEIKISSFNLEPNLDYEYSTTLAYPLPVINIQVGDKFLGGNLNTMLAAFDEEYCKTALDPEFDPVYPDPRPGGYNSTDCGTYQPPRVIAIAYAWNEAWYSDTYARRQCLEFLKLGLQGVTVLTGSGDRGPADQLGYCINPETGNYTEPEGNFASVFPASCPWVTTVGGTQFQPTNNRTWTPDTPFPDETALSDNVTQSGGGFSRLFPAPWYQADLTRDYLADAEGAMDLAEDGYFDPQGRGYPDISAIARNYLVSLYGGYRATKGTSTSVPLIASMIAKINDARLHAGKSTVGFVNPVLYANRKDFIRDVKEGVSSGCGVDEAFPATEGWDAVTGLGSPDFAKLKELYLSLP